MPLGSHNWQCQRRADLYEGPGCLKPRVRNSTIHGSRVDMGRQIQSTLGLQGAFRVSDWVDPPGRGFVRESRAPGLERKVGFIVENTAMRHRQGVGVYWRTSPWHNLNCTQGVIPTDLPLYLSAQNLSCSECPGVSGQVLRTQIWPASDWE